jgi:N-acetylglucosamine kinase-like BadF-type ATPase
VRAAHLFYAGFDGGGTKTTCVLCDSKGTVLGVGPGGPSNFHNTGTGGALASLAESFRGALAMSGLRRAGMDLVACYGLAGLDSPKDFAIMRRAIASMRLASTSTVVNDWRTAVTGAFIDEPGVVLIAGTGCVAAAQSKGGRRVVRVGGWGLIVDDRGSAYDIGRESLHAAMRDYDGRGPKTALLQLIMRRLKVTKAQGIIERVYVGGMSPSEIASLAILVSEAAAAEDAVALRILAEKGRTLGELVVSAASKAGLLGAAFGVCLHGGVFRAGKPIVAPLEGTVRAAAPSARIVEAELPPACGAVLLSMRRERMKVGSDLTERMRSSLEAKRSPSG